MIARNALAAVLSGLLLATSPSLEAAAKPDIPGIVVPDLPADVVQALRSQRRMALVIGNGEYADSPLLKPPQDARSIAAALEYLGFEVTLHTDLGGEAMTRAVDAFADRLRASGALGLFFYSGHGVETPDGVGYLIPVDLSTAADETAVRHRAMPLGYVLGRMERARDGIDILLIDACRNSRWVRSFRGPSGTGGTLRPMEAGKRSLVGFSTSTGQPASEGGASAPHSPFTHHLLSAMFEPGGLPLRTILDRVQDEVRAETEDLQIPAYRTTLGRTEVYFIPPPSRVCPPERETALWEEANRADTADAFHAFLATCPDAERAEDARRMGNLLQKIAKLSAPPPMTPPQALPAPKGKTDDGSLAKPRTQGQPRNDTPGPPLGRTASVAAPPAPGTVFRDCPDCPEMVVLGPGKFLMGSPKRQRKYSDEGPDHPVNIRYSFAMGRFEVTFGQWDACVSDGRCRPADDNGWGRGTRPVINVSWNDAQDYVRWLSQKTGHKYRLPSEAEWEFGARAGTSTVYPWGDEIGRDTARYRRKSSDYGTVPVGSFPANQFKLFDMHGNVREWVQDCRHDDYVGAPDDGSVWQGTADRGWRPVFTAKSEEEMEKLCRRTYRGGSWYDSPKAIRSAYRGKYYRDMQSSTLGFRIVRDLRDR